VLVMAKAPAIDSGVISTREAYQSAFFGELKA
jgi:hypothetical protein